jgi:hypothetical protein
MLIMGSEVQIHFLDLGTKRKGVVNCMCLSLNPEGRNSYPLNTVRLGGGGVVPVSV